MPHNDGRTPHHGAENTFVEPADHGVSKQEAEAALREVDSLTSPPPNPVVPAWAIITVSLIAGVCFASFALADFTALLITFVALVLVAGVLLLGNRTRGVRHAVMQPLDREARATPRDSLLEKSIYVWIIAPQTTAHIGEALGRPSCFALLAGALSAAHCAAWLHAMNRKHRHDHQAVSAP